MSHSWLFLNYLVHVYDYLTHMQVPILYTVVSEIRMLFFLAVGI
jgi:ABC-type microcin C transport system permease subunit YejB